VSLIVGVHGIAQQQLGRKQLLRDWGPALSDGVEAALGRPPADPPFDLAFYGKVFDSRSALTKGSSSPIAGSEDELLANLSEAETAELVKDAAEALTPAEIAAAETLPPSKAYTRTPRPVQVVLRALDAKFGAAAGVFYLGAVRQVRRYLVDPEVKSQVDDIVDRAVPAACRVLVGHSLGSVVALEFLRRHPDRRMDLFVTVGSPLGLRMVRSRLPSPSFGTDSLPPNVAAWVNVRDPRDPVACAGPLCRWWPGVDERVVDNEGDAHNVARYLSKIETGSAILDAVPQLAVPEDRVSE
jgi:predicted alpha/beta hydrolase family esterase